MNQLPSDEDEAPDDDAPFTDPDPGPPAQADVAIHEDEIVRNGYTLDTDEGPVDVSFAPNKPRQFSADGSELNGGDGA